MHLSCQEFGCKLQIQQLLRIKNQALKVTNLGVAILVCVCVCVCVCVVYILQHVVKVQAWRKNVAPTN
jgi:hypothetical protein